MVKTKGTTPATIINSPDHLVKSVRDRGSRKKDFRNSSLNSLIISKLKKGNMLDVGCGPGYLVHYTRKNND